MSKKINKSLPKEFRLKQIGINSKNLKMTIIKYKSATDIDVQFEDGTIVKNKEYSVFLKGNIKHPNYYNNLRIGETNVNNQGLKMTIIKYEKYDDIDVQFEDGTIVENKSYDHFLKGHIINKNYRIGETNINNQGLKMVIIGYKDSHNINVQFEDGTIVENRQYGDFLIGNIVNPNEHSDGISIPNKMLRQISFQLGLNLQFEYSPIWLENKRLDGYDDNLKIAIEMDGEYYNNHKGERKEIDNWKDEQCLKNGIYVIRINLIDDEYNKNKFEYIKKQILSSSLSLIYDLSNINWELAWENSLKNLVWEVKRLIEEGYNNRQISEILGITDKTIIEYKKQVGIKVGNELKQDNIKKTKELLKQGKTVREISEILNLSKTIIYRYKKELNL